MNVYDQAHALARSLKESDEYREYMRLKDLAYADETNKALLDEYKRLQYQMQLCLAQGERMEEESLHIYKILADVAGINLDMLAGQ